MIFQIRWIRQIRSAFLFVSSPRRVFRISRAKPQKGLGTANPANLANHSESGDTGFPVPAWDDLPDSLNSPDSRCLPLRFLTPESLQSFSRAKPPRRKVSKNPKNSKPLFLCASAPLREPFFINQKASPVRAPRRGHRSEFPAQSRQGAKFPRTKKNQSLSSFAPLRLCANHSFPSTMIQTTPVRIRGGAVDQNFPRKEKFPRIKIPTASSSLAALAALR